MVDVQRVHDKKKMGYTPPDGLWYKSTIINKKEKDRIPILFPRVKWRAGDQKISQHRNLYGLPRGGRSIASHDRGCHAPS